MVKDRLNGSTLRQVQWVIAGDNREVLDRCVIGWCKSPISNADLTRALRSDDIVLLQVMRLFGDRVLLIFDDADVRSKMLASDILSKLFDRFVEWNEEDCAMGYSERMENPTQDVPAEQEENESMVSVPIVDGVELQIGPVAEGSTMEILFHNGMSTCNYGRVWEVVGGEDDW
ncbi:hypothetical protein V6N13_032085 [Hibiscus sabdariffa]